MRWLAYGHPALMAIALTLIGIALRRGFELRRRRRLGAGGRGPILRAHLAVARPAVILVVIGMFSGPASALLLRDWEPLHTFHGWAGLAAGLLFAATGWLGGRIRDRRSRAVELHARLALAAVLAGAVAAIAGFVLLP